MANCRNCGEEISDFQYNNFGGMCSECVRVSNLKKGISRSGIENQGTACMGFGILLIMIGIIIGPILFSTQPSPHMAQGLFFGIAFVLIVGSLLTIIGYYMKKSAQS